MNTPAKLSNSLTINYIKMVFGKHLLEINSVAQRKRTIRMTGKILSLFASFTEISSYFCAFNFT